MRNNIELILLKILCLFLVAVAIVLSGREPDCDKNLDVDTFIDVSEYNPVLDNVNQIQYQEIETTYHNYIVVVDKGKVVANGVIHSNKCKCSDKTVQ